MTIITGDSNLVIEVARTFFLMAFRKFNQETTISNEVVEDKFTDNKWRIILILLSKIGRAGLDYTVLLVYTEIIATIIIPV